MSNRSEGKDVLSSLPRSRPERRSTKRDGARASKPKAKPKVGHATRPSAATRRVRAETAKTPSPKAEQVAPADRDIVTTTVQAVGELARIGITVGTQIVREATRRLPKP